MIYRSPRCVRSLNGYHDALNIRHHTRHFTKFSDVMCAIKIWKMKRGIDDKKQGYMTSITWSIIAAAVVTQNPNEQGADEMLFKIFQSLSNHDWNEKIQLDSKESVNHPLNLGWLEWGTKEDENELLKVLTSSYPCRNTAKEVSPFALSKTKLEIRRAYDICGKIRNGEATWFELFSGCEL